MESIQAKKRKRYRINWKSRFKMAINKHLSIITLNVNGLNAPIKRQSGRMDKKKEPTIRFPKETQFRVKDTYRLKVRRWKKIFHADTNDK